MNGGRDSHCRLIGLVTSRMIATTPRKTNSPTTAAATGASFRMSASRPVIFSYKATTKCPPSSGKSGNRLMVAKITLTRARIPKNAAADSTWDPIFTIPIGLTGRISSSTSVSPRRTPKY